MNPVELIRSLFNAGECRAAQALASVARKQSASQSPAADNELLGILAGCAFHEKNFASAAAYLEVLFSRGVRDDASLLNYAKCLYYVRRAPEALAVMREVASRNPQSVEVLILLGMCHFVLGQFDESARIARTLPREHPDTHFLLGWHTVHQGKFFEGMKILENVDARSGGAEYEFGLPRAKRYVPGAPVAGRTILVTRESGLGDEFLRVRFLQTLKERGARVILGCSPSLLSVFRRLPFADRVDVIENILPSDYDAYIPLGMAVGMLGIEHPLRGFDFPYITSTPKAVEKWRPVIEKAARGRPAIALRWQGGQKNEHMEFRSVPFKKLLPFAELGALFSLQRDGGEEEMGKNDPIYDLGSGLESWEDTLGALENVEYVVTSCTSVAHAAAALGKKTLVLATHAPFIAWPINGTRSDWYPNVRVFRQTKYSSWDEAIENALAWMRDDRKGGDAG